MVCGGECGCVVLVLLGWVLDTVCGVLGRASSFLFPLLKVRASAFVDVVVALLFAVVAVCVKEEEVGADGFNSSSLLCAHQPPRGATPPLLGLLLLLFLWIDVDVGWDVITLAERRESS